MTENQIATTVVDTAFHIHSDIGPGLFEKVYERIMEVELGKRGLIVLRQDQYRLCIKACTSNRDFAVICWLKTN
jgi:GxxExxY protein